MNENEMDKLESYLLDRGFNYERIEEAQVELNGIVVRHGRDQIVVYDEDGFRLWDAICHYGSYGYEQGLLEIYGSAITKSDDVIGWLTAEEVIARIEGAVL